MQPISLSKYKSLIPEETYKFIYQLFKYLYINTPLEAQGEKLYNIIDIIFFKSLKAYQNSYEGKSVLSSLSFNDETFISEYSSFNSSDLFSKYYKYLTPFKNEEEYLALTPEDIIINIYKDATKTKYSLQTLNLIHNDIKYFFNELQKVSNDKKEKIILDKENEYFKKCTISVINYFNSVSKIYKYLDNNKEHIQNIKPTSDNLRALSYILAIFYYENVYAENNLDEKKFILEHFNSIGLTAKKIESTIGIDLKNINTDSSILTLINKLNIDVINKLSSEEKNVGGILYKMIDDSLETGPEFKNVLALCGVTCQDAISYYPKLKEMISESNTGSITEMYNNLMPNIINLYNRLIKIYSFLKKYKDIDKNYVSCTKDYVALSLLISCYLDNDNVSIFLTDNNIDFDKLLEILNLPKKEELIKLIESEEIDQSNIFKFKKILTKGYISSNSKQSITSNLIYKNLSEKEYSESEIINKIYNSVNNKILPLSFSKLVDKHIEEKENNRLLNLKEKLFKDVSIDVYNYLTVVYSYYQIFKKTKLSHEDAIQLSIIYGACKYDNLLNKYLESEGITTRKLTSFFNLDYIFDNYKINVEVLNKEFGKYIFDRDPNKITVHSIFENAFNPKLTNSVMLRQALFKYNKKPEDFLDIDDKLKKYELDLKNKKEHDDLVEAYGKINKNAEQINRAVLILYDYLKTNIKNNLLLQNDDDYKEMAILLVNLLPSSDRVEYFKMYNITLEYVLSLIGLKEIDLNNILKNKCKNELIYEFNNYYSSKYKINLEDYPQFVFDHNNLIKKILTDLNQDYSSLYDSVINKKEKRISPIDGIKMLGQENIKPIKEQSISFLAVYGDELAKHSKYINGALQELVFNNRIDDSIKDVNKALESVITEEKIEPKKLGFWESLFTLEEPVKVIKKYNPEKIGDLQDAIDKQLLSLTKELEGYEYIKKYIELYLTKLDEQLKELKENYSLLDVEVSDLKDIESFTKTLDQKTKREIINSKISTTETMTVLMKQELLSVHRAIINHFITINSLQTSKNTILPILASELIINAGNKSESDALELTNDLISLLQSVVNKNVNQAQQNLQKLKITSMSAEAFNSLNKEINLYLEDITRGQKLLDSSLKNENDLNQKEDIQILEK